jgi:predicted aspartyl protease
MRIEKFKRDNHESLILVKCQFPNHTIALALDTGASHTTIDLTALMIAGYSLSESIRTVQLETASGIIDAYVFKIRELKALGITQKGIEVCAYDFFAHHVLTAFDGVLGLDFLGDYKICIDFKKSEITLQ